MRKVFHKLIPDDPVGCLQWRADTVGRLAARDQKIRDWLWNACKEDVLFFFKGFVDLYEPRICEDGSSEPQILPFIPWTHQLPVIEYADEWLGKRDIRVSKSRAQGASYLYAMMFFHRWMFHSMFKGNIVSKDENAADNPTDPDSVMWKIDFALKQLPDWMRGEKGIDWKRNVTDHTLTNLRNGSVIRSYACTENVASGGRATAFIMDEIAKFRRGLDDTAVTSTQAITRCRVFVSSPFGPSGAYYKLIHDKTLDDPVQILDWKDNPSQNRGLYHVVPGPGHTMVPCVFDAKKYGQLPDRYYDRDWFRTMLRRLKDRGYNVSQSKFRSPWYDEECLRPGASPVTIAQELDQNFGGSVVRYFSEALIDRLEKEHARPPLTVGEMSFTSDSFKPHFVEMDNGRFMLWFPLDVGGRAPIGNYVVACDIASGVGGSGSSNSSMTVFDRTIGKKVGEFATPNLLPYQFAELAIAVCKFFVNERGQPAYLIWETNGLGNEFGKRIIDAGYRDFFYRDVLDSVSKQKTSKPGWYTKNKSDLLGPYREALIEGGFVNPSKASLDECRQIQVGDDGEPYHVAEKGKDDPAGAKAAHADRVISDALSWIAARDLGKAAGLDKVTVTNVTEQNAPVGSFAHRRARHLRESKSKGLVSRW